MRERVDAEMRIFGDPNFKSMAEGDDGLRMVGVLLFRGEKSPEISFSQSRRSWEKGGVGMTRQVMWCWVVVLLLTKPV